MNEPHQKGVWFIYDGECPICQHAAFALRIKEEYGVLHLINARKDQGHDLLMKINKLGLDLDEGMVIFADEQFYHGRAALRFMAHQGAPRNLFNVVCKSLFWSDTIAKVMYPWMRGMRNFLIKRKKAGRIDNLGLKIRPIFQDVFGEQWDALPEVIKRHYANRPYTSDEVVVEGELDLICRAHVKLLAPVLKFMKQIPAHSEECVPVTVRFQSDEHSKMFGFNRLFNFKMIKPYRFQSRMYPIRDNVVVEVMPYGIGWKMAFDWDGEKVVLSHKGYVLKAFGHFIPIPMALFLGEGYAEETPIDDETFDMMTQIIHPWFGVVYEYKGRFKITQDGGDYA